jgi:serine/threonine protein kinase
MGFLMIDWGDFQVDHKRYPYEENGSGLFMAPEMPSGTFDNKVDSYSLGIILAQMCLGDADLFRKFGTLKKTERVFFWERLKDRKDTDKYHFWQCYAQEGLDQFWTEELVYLINALTEYNPEARLSCVDALKHPYFQTESSI